MENESPNLSSPRPAHRLKVVSWLGLGVIAVASLAYFGLDVVYANRVLPGVKFLALDLGGLSYGATLEVLDDQLGQARLSSLRLAANGQFWDIDPNQFDFQVDARALAREAIAVGRRGNFRQRLQERLDAVIFGHQPIIEPTDLVYDFDQTKLEQFLASIASEIDQPRQDAKLVIKNNRATEFVPSQTGLTLDTPATIALIARSLFGMGETVELPVMTTEPQVTLAQTNTLGIRTLIARGISDFSGSPRNRRHNIGVGAKRFDGVLVAPGETFSFIRVLGDVDASTGYLPELVIKGDQTTPEFGGGLCQVSTTAFRAILNGGLPIVERRNHSYRVVYYEPAGTDATIYQPYPDLKFTNDTPGHILMDTYIVGSQLYFDFYGTDTQRQVTLDGPHISNVTAYPDPIYIDTSTLPPGETKQIDSAHRGADAVLYRKVYQNGKLLLDDTFKSHYIPWPAKYLRGVEDAAKVDTNLENILPEDTASETSPINPLS
jgi:vancomycin resistance protein YoaR